MMEIPLHKAPSRHRGLLIDSATAGTAGAYIDAILKALDDPQSVQVGVSYHFPFDYGLRYFYRYSELSAQSRFPLGRFRLYVRFVELTIALVRIYTWILRSDVRFVCYALSSNLWIEYFFLWLVSKTTSCTTMLICHDVVPFLSAGEELDSKMKARSKFYRLADRLIVHNENSELELRTLFRVPASKMTRFPFPIYDLSFVQAAAFLQQPDSLPPRFLFVGHLRPEKGIEVLMRAWQRVRATLPDATLTVAGNVPVDSPLSQSNIEGSGISFVSRYLSDEEYIGMLSSADCVVLPYIRGTNSAVASTVLSMRRHLIASDIPMFRNNPLIPEESFFVAGNELALAERMIAFGQSTAEQRMQWVEVVNKNVRKYEVRFRSDVNAVFASST